MSEIITKAVEALSAKLGDAGYDGSAKFVIEGEGSIMIDGSGVRAADDDANVTLTASAETFQGILEGDINPTSAFMTGKLSLDGDMGEAMKLAGVLA
ncbi:SCP2 sterol-binding domain-containing protein [Pelagovum sp. HNIBRBA483]|uniref:SCP2 sterol-binding domain-containing protein n=1 Tax=Pelagovum sp. HNIBRBA483 TaxID=3233341 RepID=UPI0034A0E009